MKQFQHSGIQCNQYFQHETGRGVMQFHIQVLWQDQHHIPHTHSGLYIRRHPSALCTLKVQTVMHAKVLKQLLHMMQLGNKRRCHTSHTGCENLRTRTSGVIYYQWYKEKTPHVALSHLQQLSLKHKCAGEKRPNMWTMTQNC